MKSPDHTYGHHPSLSIRFSAVLVLKGASLENRSGEFEIEPPFQEVGVSSPRPLMTTKQLPNAFHPHRPKGYIGSKTAGFSISENQALATRHAHSRPRLGGIKKMTSSPCPFCSPDPARVFFRGDRVFALWDAFPVNPGHALLIPTRHMASWFDATDEEQAEILRAIALVQKEIETRHTPHGYNIGFNEGWAAGQTVDHLHVHVIPRYEDDVPDPRGGIRWVIPERAPYWEDE